MLNPFALFLKARIEELDIDHTSFLVSRSTVERWLAGVTVPHRSQVMNIAAVLQVNESEIFKLWRESKKSKTTVKKARYFSKEQMISTDDLEYLLEISRRATKPLSLRTLLELLNAR